MGIEEITVWTCDRCGLEEKLEGRSAQPANWTRWYFATPPRSSEKSATIGVLCNECGGLVHAFIQGNEEREIADAARIAETMREVHLLGSSRESIGELIRDALRVVDETLKAQRITLKAEDANALERLRKVLK